MNKKVAEVTYAVRNSRNNYLKGFYRFFDVSGSTSHRYQFPEVFSNRNPLEIDRERLAGDWNAVGVDIQNSIQRLSRRINDKEKRR